MFKIPVGATEGAPKEGRPYSPRPSNLKEMLAKMIRQQLSPMGLQWLCTTTLGVVLALIFLPRPLQWFQVDSPGVATITTTGEIDAALQRSAAAALQEREGTIIVMDPKTGRLRAVVNPTIAFEEAYTPGSTVKPFVALAALQSGVITKRSRLLCRERYSHHDFSTVCSHPSELSPFDPAAAIAYSCNYYFGRLGEQLSNEKLVELLGSFGFGRPTRINALKESCGRLVHSKQNPRNFLGEGPSFETTPIQLLRAYGALVNGGQLLTPHLGPAEALPLQVSAQLSIDPEHRELIVNGMRGAVVYGSAKTAQLSSLPLTILGKTGTATPSSGFRSHGWFIGFAASDASYSPPGVSLAVLVFVKRGQGRDAAELARPVFEEYSHWAQVAEKRVADIDPGSPDALYPASYQPEQPVTASFRPPQYPSAVSVHLVRENLTRQLSFEDYVLGVVKAEGSMETQLEALKALAIAARTYAVRNLRRHITDGYDFCSSTHCQRYVVASAATGSNRCAATMVQAVRETAGILLRDRDDKVADVYFSASCGGMTANMQTLWGASTPEYLRGVRDEYCATGTHHQWTDVIPAKDLATALRSDPRTDVGEIIHSVSVVRHDLTGRAEVVEIAGERRRQVRGWDFKIIVGRSLGWQLLKSSRFEVWRSGPNFVFRGNGFGHGLGLCQEGAHTMAERGANYRQILQQYFPGVKISRESDTITKVDGPAFGSREAKARADAGFSADLQWNPKKISVTGIPKFRSEPRRALSSEHFRVNYPPSVNKQAAAYLLKILESNRQDLIDRVFAAGIRAQIPALEIYVNPTTGDFTGRTGQPWWAAAATKGKRIELQPLELLRRRSILETTLRHELVHALIDEIGQGHTPRWLAEGLALHIAGEGSMVSRSRSARTRGISVAELELQLAGAGAPEEMRAAYAEAYQEVSRLMRVEGEASVWRRVAHGAKEPSHGR